jgi:hypothetical protein
MAERLNLSRPASSRARDLLLPRLLSVQVNLTTT